MESHEYANLFPLMSDAVTADLVASIKEIGLEHPIVTLDGKILDGRNRYAACLVAGVTPAFKVGGGCKNKPAA
jgi:ParB-like chromosome segregation protein Spo0J